jgi:hypothetical protein
VETFAREIQHLLGGDDAHVDLGMPAPAVASFWSRWAHVRPTGVPTLRHAE